MLFTTFAGVGLLIAAIGLYTVTAYSVSQRTQEIGVRIAMGATASTSLRHVFAQGLQQFAVGLILGLGGAVALTRLLKSVIGQISPTDPASFIGAALVLAVAAVLGMLVPARRALRVDPIVALRSQ